MNSIQLSKPNKCLYHTIFSLQLNCKYLGSRIENDIAQALLMTPQLVKLGVTMEFRDSLNKTAIQLQKNLDKRTSYCSDFYEIYNLLCFLYSISYFTNKHDSRQYFFLYFRAANRRSHI